MVKTCVVMLVAGAALATVTAPVRAAATPGAQEAAAAPPTLEALVAEALEKSEELAALRDRIDAAEALVRPAGALPDPMAMVAISNVPVAGLELDRTPMTGVDVGIEQSVPAGRKRRLRREVQSKQVAVLNARYGDLRNNLVRQVQRAYYDVQYFGEALMIAQRNKDVAQDLLGTAEALYRTGRGLQQDVFRAQVRSSRMIDEQVAAKQKRAAASVRLNRLLYRPAGQQIPPLPALRRQEVELDRGLLEERALNENPRLWNLEERLGQSQTRLELAEAGLRPDYKLGLRYRVRQEVAGDPAFGEDFWSASVGVTLPWVYRREKVDQEVKSAEAAREAAGADLGALRNELSAGVEELVVEVERLDEQLDLLDTGLLPQAEGALASSWPSYETGKVEFLTVLDNQLNLYNLYLQRSRLLADRQRMLAELAYTVGGPLAALPRSSEVSDVAE